MSRKLLTVVAAPALAVTLITGVGAGAAVVSADGPPPTTTSTFPPSVPA